MDGWDDLKIKITSPIETYTTKVGNNNCNMLVRNKKYDIKGFVEIFVPVAVNSYLSFS